MKIFRYEIDLDLDLLLYALKIKFNFPHIRSFFSLVNYTISFLRSDTDYVILDRGTLRRKDLRFTNPQNTKCQQTKKKAITIAKTPFKYHLPIKY